MGRAHIQSATGARRALTWALIAALAVPALAGCNAARKADFAFDGQFFRAKARKAGDAREVFEVSVRPVSASLAGAREAGRYEATRYCVETYGNSTIFWQIGPDSPDEALPIDGDTLTLSGVCEG